MVVKFNSRQEIRLLVSTHGKAAATFSLQMSDNGPSNQTDIFHSISKLCSFKPC
jgi:hypothetical protein